MDIEAEVSVKDIVSFYIKINDSSKAKKDLAQLSAKDKAAAFEIIADSSATRDFRVDVARYFIYDLDARVRRKAERFMEDLVPGWVTDPAESILKLLKSADGKGPASRNSAVKFLFGIVDSGSLRDTFLTLLNSRNRAHMAQIIAILEDYIDSSRDEPEQVKIFDACLDIVVSDDADDNIKHQASNLLSVFFKKVRSTNLGETLRHKYIERQVDKAEGVYRFLCSGSVGLSTTLLADLLRPLAEGGSSYQITILNFFRMVLEKSRTPDGADTVLDTYPDYWNQDEPSKEEKIHTICSRIQHAVDQLWDVTDDQEVRSLIIKIRYDEYANKRDLLEQIRLKAEDKTLPASAREKLALMLPCFLHPEQTDDLKLQATRMLLFTFGDTQSRLAALDYLAFYLENRQLNYAEKGSIATVVESLLKEKRLGERVRERACYLLFIADQERIQGEENQKLLLGYLRGVITGKGFASENAEKRVLDALNAFSGRADSGEKLKKAAQYLEFKIKNPKAEVTWSSISR
jgi:hypothetical protein